MAGINDYSNTAGSNTTINGIDIAEGCSPAGINNAIRQLMADIADMDDGVVPLQTPDINGGTIDGATIGGSSTIDNSIIGGTTPAAGTFTNLTATGTLTGLLGNVVEDVTPQLGGNLDLNSNDITGTGNIDITGNITASGNLAGTLTTASQPNITSVGTLTSATVSGDLTVDTDTLYVDSTNNNVGIGNTTPSTTSSGNNQLVLGNATTSTGMAILSGTASDGTIAFNDTTTSINRGLLRYSHSSDVMRIYTAGSERMRIDNSGNVGIGTSSPIQLLHLYKSSGVSRFLVETGGSTDASQAGFQITTPSRNWQILAKGSDNDLQFYDGTAISERMRIDSSGNVLVGKTSATINNVGVELRPFGNGGFTRDGGAPLNANRQTDDGNLVQFFQDGVQEGNISVSGTTVSYNGGHLSRWSQLLDNTKDESIVKGTVMSNLDDMCVWGDEDNEQLNKMKVSDTEGDDNVAGVFVNWDNDDDVYTNDMNIAMTGDMVIRIAQGVPVHKGQLLMSAGDGTAKPQGDDIVRSKTIAKVTSNNVSKTYDDGSYLVPCVLMAC